MVMPVSKASITPARRLSVDACDAGEVGGTGPRGEPNRLWWRTSVHRDRRRLPLPRDVLDVWSRGVVGWAMAAHQRTELMPRQ
jgi:hypothetical protein